VENFPLMLGWVVHGPGGVPDQLCQAFSIKSLHCLILEIVKQNQEFKTLLIEQQTKMLEQQNKLIELSSKPNNITNTNSNNNNKTFNLNVFLNETCKDAMNITDFIQNLNIQLQELENVGNNGYVTGISDIIVSRIKDLDV
jgi:hypothetical protein